MRPRLRYEKAACDGLSPVFRLPISDLRIAVLAILLLAGCTASRIPESPQSPTYTRQVAPFEVRGAAAGRAYEMPFLGGLNVPRPQFVDIDADGDPDLFVQELTGEVMFFENTGTPAAPDFTWRTDRFEGLDVGEWYRFADLDRDGDFDLLAEERFSHVRVYRNVGTPEAARFRLAVDTLRTAAGEPLFADRQNILNVADLDCDGLLDLFIGRVEGTVMHYESVGLGENDLPRFALVTPRFENIEIIGQIGSLHGANTLAFADYDRDGDLDLFWGDFFEPSLLLIENRGTCANPDLQTEPVPFPPSDPVRSSGYNAPAFADLDDDGDLDFLVGVLGGAFNPARTAGDNLYYYEHTDGGYALRTRRFLAGVDVGSESTPAFADLDADGDLDLFVAGKITPDDPQTSRLYRFENTGTPSAPSLVLADSLDLAPGYHYAPAFADLDADGDLDLVVGTWKGDLALYRNEGTAARPAFRAADPAFVRLTRGSNATPAFADLDGDGDLDLMVGEASGTLNFYRNEGTPGRPGFVLVSDEYGGFDVGRRSAPAFTDLDGDGDLDLVVGREAGGLVVLRNEGTSGAPSFAEDPTFVFPVVPDLSTPAFADLDGDGDLDLVSGGAGGGLVYFERSGR